MKTKHNIDRKYGIAYCRILKKKSFLKNEKVANRKLGNLENLGNIIPSFLISKFSILPYSQNRKLGFKNLNSDWILHGPDWILPGELWHFTHSYWLISALKFSIRLCIFAEWRKKRKSKIADNRVFISVVFSTQAIGGTIFNPF